MGNPYVAERSFEEIAMTLIEPPKEEEEDEEPPKEEAPVAAAPA